MAIHAELPPILCFGRNVFFIVNLLARGSDDLLMLVAIVWRNMLMLGNKINKIPDLYAPHNPVQSAYIWF
jgi:hypothetical protein